MHLALRVYPWTTLSGLLHFGYIHGRLSGGIFHSQVYYSHFGYIHGRLLWYILYPDSLFTLWAYPWTTSVYISQPDYYLHFWYIHGRLLGYISQPDSLLTLCALKTFWVYFIARLIIYTLGISIDDFLGIFHSQVHYLHFGYIHGRFIGYISQLDSLFTLWVHPLTTSGYISQPDSLFILWAYPWTTFWVDFIVSFITHTLGISMYDLSDKFHSQFITNTLGILMDDFLGIFHSKIHFLHFGYISMDDF